MRALTRPMVLALAAWAVCALLPGAAWAGDRVVEQVTTGPAESDGPYHVYDARLSRDGKRVLFETVERLVPEDQDSARDVYERAGGETTLVSVGPGGGEQNAFFESATDDGLKIAFYTTERLTADDTDTAGDAYLRSDGQTQLLTPGTSLPFSFIDFRVDGARVRSFIRTTESLAPGDRRPAEDLLNEEDIYELSAGAATQLTPNTDRDHFVKGISSDGARVIFESSERLVPEDMDSGGPTTGTWDVYMAVNGRLELVSTGPLNAHRDLNQSFRGMSKDASRIFFSSGLELTADDLDANQCTRFNPNGNTDVIGCVDVYERAHGVTTLISVGETEPVKGHGSFAGASPDGTHVFFTSETPFTAETESSCTLRSCGDLYERFAGRTRHVSTGPADAHAPEARVVGENPIFEAVTSDGSKVFFRTYEQFVLEDQDHCYDIYSWSDGVTELISTGPTDVGCDEEAINEVTLDSISSDGTRALFTSGAALTADDTDSGCTWFDSDDQVSYPLPCTDVYERYAGTTRLVSTGPGAHHGPYQATGVDLSADGTVALFTTAESLVAGDTDDCPSNDPWAPPLPPGCTDVYSATLAPPDCSEVTADVARLFPANKRFRRVRLSGAVDAGGGVLPIQITGVTQDEPVGRRAPDARLRRANKVRLRAERKAKGDGRVYRIAFRASDSEGQSCAGETIVEVRRHKKRAAVDSAPPSFNSLRR